MLMKNTLCKQFAILLFINLSSYVCFAQCNTNYPNTSVNYRTMISGPDQTPLTYMCPQDILYINAPNAQGRAFTQFGAGNGSNYKKPLILVEGLDLDIGGNGDQGDRIGDRGWPNFISHTSNERDPDDHILDKLATLLPALNSAGYDFIYLDFNNGAAKMQDNAMVLIELINIINVRNAFR